MKIDFPTIAPKHITEFDATEYHAYVKGLKEVRQKAAPPAPWTFRFNKKGTPVLTIRRRPQWMLHSEIEQICKSNNLPLGEFWATVKKRCPIFQTEVEALSVMNLVENFPW